MNIDSVNKWLTLAANVGVIAGIVFLGLEIQQNSEALQAGSRQGLLEADIVVLDNYMDYPQIYPYANHENLTGDDAIRIQVLFITMLRIREFAWLQYNNGFLDEQTFTAYLEPLRVVFNSDVGREYLLGGTFGGDPEFKEYVVEYMGLRE